MGVLDYKDGFNILQSAFSTSRAVLKKPQLFLYTAHAYYEGWLEKDNSRKSILDSSFDNIPTDDPLGNLRMFISSDISEPVSFLREGFSEICRDYSGKPSYFLGLYRQLSCIPLDWFDDFWGRAFDEILSIIYHSLGKESAEFTQPIELAILIDWLDILFSEKASQDRTIYDPFAGIGVFLNAGSYGHEINPDVYALGRLRMLAFGYGPGASENFICADSTNCWAQNRSGISSFDSILSFPPMGLRVPVTENMGIQWPNDNISLEDFLIYKGIRSLNNGGHLVGVFSNGILFSGNATGLQRRQLIRDGRIQMVVQLPSGLLTHTGMPVCAMVISEPETHCDSILMMDASSFYEKEKRHNVLRIDDLLEVIIPVLKGKSSETDYPDLLRRVPIDEIEENEYSLNVARYIRPSNKQAFEIPDGFQALHLHELVSIDNGRPSSIDEIRTIRGRDLSADGPIEYDSFERLPLEKVDGRVITLRLDAILVLKVGRLKPTLYKAQDGVPVALRSNVVALIPKQGIDPYYLVSELRKPYVTEQVESLSEGSVIPHLKNRDLLSIRVLMPVERELQRGAFLTSQRLEKEQQLKSLQFDEYVKRERGRLDAMMSIRRHRINPYISGLQNNVSMLLDELFSNEKLTASSEISPNYSVQDALENMEENLVELKNLFDAFTVDTNVGIAESIDLVAFLKHYNYTRKMPDRQFSLEKYLFEKSEHYPNIVFNGSNLTEVIDEIIHNAEKHFIPNTPDCAVWLSLRLNGKDVQLLILNNGEPVPSDFDEERSFVAGYHKDEKGTGQGLFRVRQLCDEFGAKIAWENDPDSIMATGLCITFKTSLD